MKSLVEERNLSIPVILKAKDSEVLEWIKGVRYTTQKARYIKQLTEIIHVQHDGKVPDSRDDLIDLPGVGPETTALVMHLVHGEVIGVNVDSHIHRVVNRLGWVP